MCKWKKWGDTRIDPCMKDVIGFLNLMIEHKRWEILGCCCGHGKYPMTIIVKKWNCTHPNELFTGVEIPRGKKFYKRDKKGVYYIPECIK